MHDNDQVTKDAMASLPVPAFENPAFAKPPALQDARVAIVTSAALTRKGGISKWCQRQLKTDPLFA